jgi:hypothetical protein
MFHEVFYAAALTLPALALKSAYVRRWAFRCDSIRKLRQRTKSRLDRTGSKFTGRVIGRFC